LSLDSNKKSESGAESPQTLPHREKFHKRFFAKNPYIPPCHCHKMNRETRACQKSENYRFYY